MNELLAVGPDPTLKNVNDKMVADLANSPECLDLLKIMLFQMNVGTMKGCFNHGNRPCLSWTPWASISRLLTVHVISPDLFVVNIMMGK
jgi:hypothetical protein